MPPIQVDTKKGNYRFLQRCEDCDHERWNKAQDADEFDAILRLSAALAAGDSRDSGGGAGGGRGGGDRRRQQQQPSSGRGAGKRAPSGRGGRGSRGGRGKAGRGGGGGGRGKGGKDQQKYSKAGGITTPSRRGIW